MKKSGFICKEGKYFCTNFNVLTITKDLTHKTYIQLDVMQESSE